jgi:hypothetical protein
MSGRDTRTYEQIKSVTPSWYLNTVMHDPPGQCWWHECETELHKVPRLHHALAGGDGEGRLALQAQRHEV